MAHPQQIQQRLSDEETQRILRVTGASSIGAVRTIQSLWSGYGHILRVTLRNDTSQLQSADAAHTDSVILKRIQVPDTPAHPRGWHSQLATDRKIESYRVEKLWYEQYSRHCKAHCDIPAVYDSDTRDDQVWLLLEDLDTHYPRRHQQLNIEQCIPALNWLARFHACHMGNPGTGLWPVGTYWHLNTRPQEFDAMAPGALKQAARALDQRLHQCRHKTLVHGDAKVANLCFSSDSHNVAFVDFQYVGRGCGMCDVIYFFSSCLNAQTCEQHADVLLDNYFTTLSDHLPAALGREVEKEWRDLYPIAWADFHRFLAGWMPEHFKINAYVKSMTEQALSELY